jgi:serine/threonine protein kinase
VLDGQRMLQYDPSKRISAKEAMNHPYFYRETEYSCT